MYFDQYDVLTTALAGKPGSAQEFPSLDAAEKWAAQHDLAKLPHTVVKPPGAGRTFYLLQIGPAAYPTLQIACDRSPESLRDRGQRTICPKSYANGRRKSHSNCIMKPTHSPVPTLSRHWKAYQLHCRKPGVCASPVTARGYPSTG